MGLMKMEKVEISLNNTVLANVWQYLYDRVKSMNHKVIEYSKFLENQDGAGYNVTYRCTVQNIQPPQNNQLLVNYTYVIEPEGKDTQVYGILPAIEFTGWQLQLDTVLINIEFLPLFTVNKYSSLMYMSVSLSAFWLCIMNVIFFLSNLT